MPIMPLFLVQALVVGASVSSLHIGAEQYRYTRNAGNSKHAAGNPWLKP